MTSLIMDLNGKNMKLKARLYMVTEDARVRQDLTEARKKFGSCGAKQALLKDVGGEIAAVMEEIAKLVTSVMKAREQCLSVDALM